MDIQIVNNAKYGRFMVNAQDQYVGQSLIQYGQYCEAEVFFLSQIISKDTIVLDIGANIGALTIPFARLSKQVYAYEPHPKLFNLLCGNLALNDLDNVQPYNMGVGITPGIMSYQDLDNFEHNNGAHALLKTQDETRSVMVTNRVPHANVVKIDVEGMELEVLKGITPMIAECQPFLFVENDRKENSDALIQYIDEVLGYKAYWCAWTLFDRDNHFNNVDNIYGNVGCANMICYPKTVELDMTTIGLNRATVGSWYQDEAQLQMEMPKPTPTPEPSRIILLA